MFQGPSQFTNKKHWIKWNIRSARDFIKYDIPYGINNLIKYFPIIWRDRNWDHYYLLRLLEFKLNGIAREHDRGITKQCPNLAKKARICAHLCNRLNQEDYWKNAEKRFGFNSLAGKYAMEIEDQDKKMLGSLLGRYITCWWT